MEFTRSSGILMPIFSLPAKYGIGTIGKPAYDFIDFLKEAGQKYWQMLPVGPISYGDSPYQSFSSFAGNPYFIDLDLLVKDGLLDKKELDKINWGENEETVDYGALYNNRFAILQKAKENGYERDSVKMDVFRHQNARWLPDYSLYMALKRHFEMKPWYEWPDKEIRLHKAEACGKYREMLKDDIALFEYIQLLFFKQWELLREYAKEKGISIIGDLPIYVALDSADVWSEPQWFELDEENVPTKVAGVPPDYFNEDGQLWGNPLYRWDDMKRDGFGWWIRRVDGSLRLFDVLRIDHFRGLASYWEVPYGSKTSKTGKWVPGPGKDFVKAITDWFHGSAFIAEDLGLLTPDVKELLDASGFPGMKVLEFAFDTDEPQDYQPHRYRHSCICYTGTHDNHSINGWLETVDPKTIARTKKYFHITDDEEFNWGVIRGGMSSVADLFIAQMQDYLGLGAESRINLPGSAGGNWSWRMKKGVLNAKLAKRIYEMSLLYERTEKRVKKSTKKTKTAEEAV